MNLKDDTQRSSIFSFNILNQLEESMLGFSLKFIDHERMILDDWMSEYEVFEPYDLFEFE